MRNRLRNHALTLLTWLYERLEPDPYIASPGSHAYYLQRKPPWQISMDLDIMMQDASNERREEIREVLRGKLGEEPPVNLVATS